MSISKKVLALACSLTFREWNWSCGQSTLNSSCIHFQYENFQRAQKLVFGDLRSAKQNWDKADTQYILPGPPPPFLNHSVINITGYNPLAVCIWQPFQWHNNTSKLIKLDDLKWYNISVWRKVSSFFYDPFHSIPHAYVPILLWYFIGVVSEW